jgi:glutamate dehydrogenase/leucine dehydrogenase
MRRYCDEVRPLIQGGRFLTGPDLGTSEADFASLRAPDTGARLMASSLGGIPFEDLLTGYGVVAAVEAAAGPLSGLSFAVEGFGKVGGGVAREAVRRGARVVAVSTIEGCVHDPAGLDVELLLQLRAAHGDGFVRHAGRPALDVAALFDTTADVLVPGARTGSVTAEVAERLKVRWVAPAANVPYTSGGLDALRARGIRALPDFVCNAGAVLGYMAPEDCGPGEVFRIVETRLSELVQRASLHPGGYVEGACEMAEAFLRTWRDELPDGRPLA